MGQYIAPGAFHQIGAPKSAERNRVTDRPDTTAGAAIGIAAMPGSARSIGMLGGSLAFGAVIVASVGIIAVVSWRM